jgi:nucleotide-binding universal stress UspA family protein
MIPKIKKILYATDLSSNSLYAFRYAVNSAEKHNAKMVILHVFEQISTNIASLASAYISPEQRDKIFNEKFEYTSEQIKRRLKTFCDRELKKEPDLMKIIDAIEVKEGFAAEEILQTAEKLDCDAIVMGSHGKGILHNTFLGSTSKQVLRRTRLPVFIIPIPKGQIDISFQDE